MTESAIIPLLSLSTTGFSQAAHCLKSYQYHFEDRLIPKPGNIKSYMRRGIWVHRCLQDYHVGKNWGDSIEALTQWCVDNNVEDEAIDPARTETATIMRGYQKYWEQNPQDVLTPLYAEREFRWTFGGVELRATVDLIAKSRYGLVIVEHKTTSQIPPSTWRAVDPQTAMQVVLARANGIPVEGVLFNYLLTKVPAIPRVKKDGSGFYANTAMTTSQAFEGGVKELAAAQANDGAKLWDIAPYIVQQRQQLVNDSAYYQRYVTYRNDAMIAESMRDVAGISREILRSRADGHWPRSFHVRNCPMYCLYSTLCNAEYTLGRISETEREANYMIDDGTREGQIAWSREED